MGYLWLECTVSNGLFEDDRSVKAQSYNGKAFSLFVDKNLLNTPAEDDKSYLRVIGTKEDETGVYVILPEDPFETGRVVKVQRSQIHSMQESSS